LVIFRKKTYYSAFLVDKDEQKNQQIKSIVEAMHCRLAKVTDKVWDTAIHCFTIISSFFYIAGVFMVPE
jgi:hypothetical protein